jgi:hypothetical protein
MYCWTFTDYYENDGASWLSPVKVFRTKKLALAAYNERVKKIFEEEINEDYDEITNRQEKEGDLYVSINYGESLYRVYVKKVKVIE